MGNFKTMSYIGTAGRMCTSMELKHAKTDKVSLKLKTWTGEEQKIAIQSVKSSGGRLVITPDEFVYNFEWTLAVGKDSYKKEDVDDAQVKGVENFEACTDGGVIYRLYSPEASQPRPMILFLHGGGHQGDDNLDQLISDFGPIHFSEEYPDYYVMVPQAPKAEGWKFSIGMPTFADSSRNKEMQGWTRPYLAAVCDVIRGMIADGRVDPRRVYVTGLSMGGAGTLRAMSVGAGLFAAAAPVCPTMTPETLGILKSLTAEKLWISTAYIDHTLYRHKYIVDGVLALKDAGNKNVHLTLYSPEELAAYGIATDPDMPLQARFGMNHMSWVLTYSDEHGILSWLTEQVRD